MLETVTATRFAVPLREGGSLPGLVDADDLGMYVVKFRGAGQGMKVPGRRGHRRRARPGAADPGPPPRRRRPAARHRPLRGRRGGPGPAQRVRGHQPRSRLPARLLRLRRQPPGQPGTGRTHRLARRLHRQHRPHPGQPQPARLGRPAVGHRPWCRVVLPPRVGPPGARRGQIRRSALRRVRPRPRRPRGRLAAPPRGLASRLGDAELARIIELVPDEWLETSDHLPDAAAVRAAYPEHLTTRRDHPDAWLPGGAR
uniref:Uncharacterized protein n=1 Tax=Janibacter limosus TaxID=53458 RepID=A0AC61U0R3_9MICO|nr:hypothetical protein [Janibacter limosus]